MDRGDCNGRDRVVEHHHARTRGWFAHLGVVTVARYVHGSSELLDHAAAAKSLSEKEEWLRLSKRVYALGPSIPRGATLEGAQQDVDNARIVLAAAYKLYTNPFGVVKTV